MADDTNTTTSAGGASRSVAPTVIVDLGNVRKSQIKKLRSGSGKLYDKVAEIIGDLRQQGTIGESAQPVVFIVGKKRKRCWI
jgi:Family of unknown function (DUF6200)